VHLCGRNSCPRRPRDPPPWPPHPSDSSPGVIKQNQAQSTSIECDQLHSSANKRNQAPWKSSPHLEQCLLSAHTAIQCNQVHSSALKRTHLEQVLAPAMLILGAGPTKHQPLAPTGLHLRELGAHVRTAGACDRADGRSVWRANSGNRCTARARDGAGRVASTGPAAADGCC
jgi:hypothetical protein